MLIDGVTVLNTYEKVISTSWGWNFLASLLLFVGIFVLVISAVLSLNDEQPLGVLGIITSTILICVCVFINLRQNPTYKIVYQVTISDSVNFNQIDENYDIIKQEGKIYHIMEKVEE